MNRRSRRNLLNDRELKDDKKEGDSKGKIITERKAFRGLEEFGDYYENRDRKLKEQAVPAQSHLFDKCVFYILGYVGRGDESRYRFYKLIEKNGGKIVLVITSHVTHVIADHLCQSKRNQLDKAIEQRQLVVVRPEYIYKCIEEQKMLDPTPFLSSKPKTRSVLDMLDKPKK